MFNCETAQFGVKLVNYRYYSIVLQFTSTQFIGVAMLTKFHFMYLDSLIELIMRVVFSSVRTWSANGFAK